MCTLTFVPLEDGYLLGMNRDERRGRGRAAVVARLAGPRRAAYPKDSDKGGTWVAANRAGLTLSLLNRHPRGWTRDEGRSYRTRGELILRVVGRHRTAKAALDDLSARLDPRAYPPFLLVGVDLGAGPVETLESDGRRWTRSRLGRAPRLFSSSSWDEAAAERSRRRQFRAARLGGAADARAHRAFHAAHRPVRGPLSVCMHREDARTVSFTQIRAGRAGVALRYLPDSPCRWRPGQVLTRKI